MMPDLLAMALSDFFKSGMIFQISGMRSKTRTSHKTFSPMFESLAIIVKDST